MQFKFMQYGANDPWAVLPYTLHKANDLSWWRYKNGGMKSSKPYHLRHFVPQNHRNH